MDKKSQENDRECSHCRMRLSEFRATGMLGCPRCYEEFEKEIDSSLVEACGTAVHKGKRYTARLAMLQNSGDLKRLRRELDEAVRREEFEIAAVIRDTIHTISVKESNEQHPCSP
jgi:protein arginine kinase activator